jgi:hypothetical protein
MLRVDRVLGFFSTLIKNKIKGTTTRFFALGFFHESFCPVPLIITLEQFRLFSKIREMLAAQGKWKKFQTRVLNIQLRHIWVLRLTYSYIFFFIFTLKGPKHEIFESGFFT